MLRVDTERRFLPRFENRGLAPRTYQRDPKLIALLFNERINNRDIRGLTQLMTDDYTLILRDGQVLAGKDANVKSWTKFFEMCPVYKNTFARIESRADQVIIIGYAYWNEKQPYDPVIWTARIEGDRVAEWRIYDDTVANRANLGLVESKPNRNMPGNPGRHL
jgi:predicted SnoaL-like aldol condensation-catalyzing enzyme